MNPNELTAAPGAGTGPFDRQNGRKDQIISLFPIPSIEVLG